MQGGKGRCVGQARGHVVWVCVTTQQVPWGRRKAGVGNGHLLEGAEAAGMSHKQKGRHWQQQPQAQNGVGNTGIIMDGRHG